MTQTDPSFESLLDFLRDGRGFDYTQYRRPSNDPTSGPPLKPLGDPMVARSCSGVPDGWPDTPRRPRAGSK